MTKQTIRDWQSVIHANARSKGWWDQDRNVGEALALCHSELSEALEELRAGHDPRQAREEGGKPEGFGIELADCVIRIMDLCGGLGIDLEACIDQKHAYNLGRPHRHGGKTC